MNKSLVSVIMPTYNRARVIKRAIDSVLEQSYINFELIVVDDGSVDNTKEVIDAYNDNRIHYYHYEKNMGANYARNYGIKLSKGKYIAFLDSDNEWQNDYLQERIRTFNYASKEIGLVYGPLVIKEKGKKNRIFPEEKEFSELKMATKKRLIKKMLFENYIDTNAVLLRRECIEIVGGFDEELARLQDWELFLKILAKTEYKAKFMDAIYVKNHIEKDSIAKKGASTYWDARIYILNKYKMIMTEYKCEESVLRHLYYKTVPKKNSNDVSKLIMSFEKDIIGTVFLKNITDIEITKLELQRINSVNNSLVSLHTKENGIIEFLGAFSQQLINNDLHIIDKLKQQKITKVAIFGFGWIGRNIYYLLKKNNIEIVAILDNRLAGQKIEDMSIVRPIDFNKNADCILVTVLDEYEVIKDEYEKNIKYLSILDFIK